MKTLEIIGVRHHSPACALLVDRAVAAKPWVVLVEGPVDFNPRLDELRLAHTPPIAIYSYQLSATNAHASWAPFCAYSPEWRALAAPRVRFIDLPAWHPAFAKVENRYADRAGDAVQRMAIERGFDSTDALWDHLFELDDEGLAARLRTYFDAYRGEPMERDAEREAYMARWIDWAMHAAPDGATIVVVCGGYHAPALRALVGTTGQVDEPEVPVADGRTGSYLVPFSFPRLDAFHGYASGMPSPGYYQAVWEGRDGDAMTMGAIERLRKRGQRVSTADAIAVHQLAHGLAQLRGHRVPSRCDLLDGLAGALLKDALRAPVPWSLRAPLSAYTDPYLVEILAAFRGDARGVLAPETPLPPLVADVTAQMKDLPFGETEAKVTLELTDPRRVVLYRLRWLDVPGVELVSTADLRRGRTRTTEIWKLRRGDATEVALIERAVYGATLELAALARIEEALRDADSVVALVALLEQALRAGFAHLVDRLVAAAEDAARSEAVLGNAGKALATLCALVATEDVRLDALLATLTERALILLESYDGPDEEFDRDSVDAVRAIRAAHSPLSDDVLARRIANPNTPPAIRGACIGARWPSPDAAAAILGVPSKRLGDLLAGLFALAREAFRERALVELVDDRLRGMTDQGFLEHLPALRRAFAFFPPGERRQVARLLAARYRNTDLLAPVAPDAAEMVALEARWFELAARFKLL